jgi:hypothetical protein
MAIFKDSGESADVFQSRDKILDEKGLQQYARQFGEERAIGYMEAVRDFNRELKVILGAGYAYDGVPKAGMKMRKKIVSLFHANDDLLDIFVSNFVSKNNSKPTG